jgi:hypothetical protein
MTLSSLSPASKPRRQRSGIGAAQLRRHPRVAHVDGRDEGHSDWFVYLEFGWHYAEDPASHAYGFDTLREALAAVRKAQPCDCEECEAEKGRAQ